MTGTAVAKEIATASALETADVVVNFQGLRAIDRVSLRLDSGEVLGLIGPNGAGKTTLVNVLTGFQEADSGSVHLGGRGHRPLASPMSAAAAAWCAPSRTCCPSPA